MPHQILFSLVSAGVSQGIGAVKGYYASINQSASLTKIAGEINNIMGDLAEQEFSNARQAFRDAQTSSSPRHELTSAINHLQSAASNFESRISREYSKVADRRGRGGTDYYAIADMRMRRVECFALITMIYMSLQEDSLVGEYINKFVNALVDYLDDSRASYTVEAFVSAKVLLDMASRTWSWGDDRYAKKFGATVPNKQGKIYYDAGKYEKALAFYTEAVQQEPKALYYLNQGAALYNLHRYQEALTAIDKAIQVSPDSAAAHDWRGWVLNSLSRYREAAQSFNEAVRLDPSDATYQQHAKDAINRI